MSCCCCCSFLCSRFLPAAEPGEPGVDLEAATVVEVEGPTLSLDKRLLREA